MAVNFTAPPQGFFSDYNEFDKWLDQQPSEVVELFSQSHVLTEGAYVPGVVMPSESQFYEILAKNPQYKKYSDEYNSRTNDVALGGYGLYSPRYTDYIGGVSTTPTSYDYLLEETTPVELQKCYESEEAEANAVAAYEAKQKRAQIPPPEHPLANPVKDVEQQIDIGRDEAIPGFEAGRDAILAMNERRGYAVGDKQLVVKPVTMSLLAVYVSGRIDDFHIGSGGGKVAYDNLIQALRPFDSIEPSVNAAELIKMFQAMEIDGVSLDDWIKNNRPELRKKLDYDPSKGISSLLTIPGSLETVVLDMLSTENNALNVLRHAESTSVGAQVSRGINNLADKIDSTIDNIKDIGTWQELSLTNYDGEFSFFTLLEYFPNPEAHNYLYSKIGIDQRALGLNSKPEWMSDDQWDFHQDFKEKQEAYQSRSETVAYLNVAAMAAIGAAAHFCPLFAPFAFAAMGVSGVGFATYDLMHQSARTDAVNTSYVIGQQDGEQGVHEYTTEMDVVDSNRRLGYTVAKTGPEIMIGFLGLGASMKLAQSGAPLAYRVGGDIMIGATEGAIVPTMDWRNWEDGTVGTNMVYGAAMGAAGSAFGMATGSGAQKLARFARKPGKVTFNHPTDKEIALHVHDDEINWLNSEKSLGYFEKDGTRIYFELDEGNSMYRMWSDEYLAEHGAKAAMPEEDGSVRKPLSPEEKQAAQGRLTGLETPEEFAGHFHEFVDTLNMDHPLVKSVEVGDVVPHVDGMGATVMKEVVEIDRVNNEVVLQEPGKPGKRYPMDELISVAARMKGRQMRDALNNSSLTPKERRAAGLRMLSSINHLFGKAAAEPDNPIHALVLGGARTMMGYINAGMYDDSHYFYRTIAEDKFNEPNSVGRTYWYDADAGNPYKESGQLQIRAKRGEMWLTGEMESDAQGQSASAKPFILHHDENTQFTDSIEVKNPLTGEWMSGPDYLAQRDRINTVMRVKSDVAQDYPSLTGVMIRESDIVYDGDGTPVIGLDVESMATFQAAVEAGHVDVTPMPVARTDTSPAYVFYEMQVGDHTVHVTAKKTSLYGDETSRVSEGRPWIDPDAALPPPRPDADGTQRASLGAAARPDADVESRVRPRVDKSTVDDEIDARSRILNEPDETIVDRAQDKAGYDETNQAARTVIDALMDAEGERDEIVTRVETALKEQGVDVSSDTTKAINSMLDITHTAQLAGIIDVPGGISRGNLAEIFSILYVKGSDDVRIDQSELTHVPLVVEGTMGFYRELTGGRASVADRKVMFLSALLHDAGKFDKNIRTEKGYTLAEGHFNQSGQEIVVKPHQTLAEAVAEQGIDPDSVLLLKIPFSLEGVLVHHDSTSVRVIVDELATAGVLTREEAGQVWQNIQNHGFVSSWILDNSMGGIGIKSHVFDNPKYTRFMELYKELYSEFKTGDGENMFAKQDMAPETTAKVDELRRIFDEVFSPEEQALLLGDHQGQYDLAKYMGILTGVPGADKLNARQLIFGGDDVPGQMTNSVEGVVRTHGFEQQVLSRFGEASYGADDALAFMYDGGLETALRGIPEYQSWAAKQSPDADSSAIAWLETVNVYEDGQKNPLFMDVIIPAVEKAYYDTYKADVQSDQGSALSLRPTEVVDRSGIPLHGEGDVSRFPVIDPDGPHLQTRPLSDTEDTTLGVIHNADSTVPKDSLDPENTVVSVRPTVASVVESTDTVSKDQLPDSKPASKEPLEDTNPLPDDRRPSARRPAQGTGLEWMRSDDNRNRGDVEVKDEGEPERLPPGYVRQDDANDPFTPRRTAGPENYAQEIEGIFDFDGLIKHMAWTHDAVIRHEGNLPTESTAYMDADSFTSPTSYAEFKSTYDQYEAQIVYMHRSGLLNDIQLKQAQRFLSTMRDALSRREP